MVIIKKLVTQSSKSKNLVKALLVVVVACLGIGTVVTFAATTDYTAPGSFKATPSNSAAYALALSWTPGAKTASATNTAGGYYIEWKIGSTGVNHVYLFNASGYAAKTYTISGLTCGTTYSIEIRAERTDSSSSTGHAGESAYSTTAGVPTCPTASKPSLTANGTASLTAKWTGTSWATSYMVYISMNGGTYIAHSEGNVTTAQISASCGNSYTAYVVASAGGQSGPKSAVSAATKIACPVVATPPPSGGGSTSPPSSTSHPTSSPSSKTSSSSNTSASTPAQPPGAPTGFVATIQSDKIIELSWNASTASAGIQDYVLNRSTDNVNWTPLATINAITYEDDATDFNTTYYYQIEAVDNSGNVSAYATTQVTTNSFSGSSSKITSDDKLVTVQVPSDAFDQQTDCTIGSNNGNSTSLSSGKDIMLLGPYDLLCVGQDGSVIDSFNKPLPVSINLSQASAGFTNFTVRTIDGSSTKAVTSSYNPKTKQISFSLTADDSFAVFGAHHKSAAGTIVGTIGGLLLLGLLVVGFLFLRRRMIAGSNPAIATAAVGSTAAEQFEQAVNKPNCTHLAMAHQVQPQSTVCEECKAAGREYKSLRICLTCGHVGCSDDSEGQDARHHFEQTQHPLIMAYNEPAAGNIGWCYIDQTYI